jgi:hypothetical protein
MRRSRLLTCSAYLAATAALCACGSSSSSSSSSSSPTPTSSSCQYASDTVVAESPVVEVGTHHITTEKTLPLACGTTLTVAGSGTAQATFGSQGLCDLQPYQNQPASMISRDPRGDLLNLLSGQLTCSVPGPLNLPAEVVSCPNGTVTARQAQWYEFCAPGQAFTVTVGLGVVRMTGSNGEFREVRKGHAMAYSSTGTFSPVAYRLPPEILRVFRLQAAALNLG